MGRTLAVAAAIAALFANTAEAGRVAEHAAHYHAPQKTEAVTMSLYKPLMAELAPQNGHYEAPPCGSDEQSVQIQGVSGDFCSPQCATPGGSCPTDVPAGTTATPTCALVVGGGSAPTYCALICQDGNTCPDGATCQNVQVSLGATPLRGLRPQTQEHVEHVGFGGGPSGPCAPPPASLTPSIRTRIYLTGPPLSIPPSPARRRHLHVQQLSTAALECQRGSRYCTSRTRARHRPPPPSAN